jgi:hypothetical protein
MKPLTEAVTHGDAKSRVLVIDDRRVLDAADRVPYMEGGRLT